MNVSYGFVSDETPTRQGLCVYCGTSRAVTKPICPECGRTWIDTKIGEELPPLTPELVAASVEQRQAAAALDLPPPPDEPRRRPWGILIGALLGTAVIALLFSGFFGGDEDDPVATPTTAVQTTEPATSTTQPTSTTASTTTAPTTTTATSTTTTTTTTTTLAPIEPEGSAVPVEDLTLGAFALGPFGFDSGSSYLGRLVASLGQPDARIEAGTDFGLCESDTGYAYSWDGFTAIFRDDSGSEILVGYRLDRTGSEHPTQAITSRSGLAVGHTIAKLDAIYLQSGLGFTEIDDVAHFVLLRSSDNATLLWGPVTGTDEDGIVEGIYSPRACDRGPTATP